MAVAVCIAPTRKLIPNRSVSQSRHSFALVAFHPPFALSGSIAPPYPLCLSSATPLTYLGRTIWSGPRCPVLAGHLCTWIPESPDEPMDNPHSETERSDDDGQADIDIDISQTIEDTAPHLARLRRDCDPNALRIL